jgi:hypothetical protein
LALSEDQVGSQRPAGEVPEGVSADQVALRSRLVGCRVDGLAGGISQMVGQIDEGPGCREFFADQGGRWSRSDAAGLDPTL